MKLRSQPESIAEVESIVERLVNRYRIDRDLYPNLLISLTEAVSNAINHGNGRDSSKYVYIKSKVKEGILHLSVRDEGPGFDHKEVPDPTKDCNLERDGGRGVLLMRELCHCIRFANKGRTVELSFKISS